MNDSVSAKFDELQRLLKRDFDRDFDTNKADICEILGMEISERYYPGRGQILQRLRNDIDVDSAARVAKDTARYRELLSAPQKEKIKARSTGNGNTTSQRQILHAIQTGCIVNRNGTGRHAPHIRACRLGGSRTALPDPREILRQHASLVIGDSWTMPDTCTTTCHAYSAMTP